MCPNLVSTSAPQIKSIKVQMWGPWESLGDQGSLAPRKRAVCGSFGPWGFEPVGASAKRAQFSHQQPLGSSSSQLGALGPWSVPSSSRNARKRAAVDFELACVCWIHLHRCEDKQSLQSEHYEPKTPSTSGYPNEKCLPADSSTDLSICI